jgi:uncharacterized delta-60 repeat protein
MQLRHLLFGLILFVTCISPRTASDVTAATGGNNDAVQEPAIEVQRVRVQNDGRILVFGIVSAGNGTFRSQLVRYHADGSEDPTIKQVVVTNGRSSGFIHNLALQPDGKIIVVGDFTNIGGVARRKVARLNIDGTVDTSFDNGTGPNGSVFGLAIQPDGKVLIGGGFLAVNGVACRRIARLNYDGSVDSTFDPGVGGNGTVSSIVIQTNGKVLIGGAFATFGGAARRGVARLNDDGSLDKTFNPTGGR